jgi:hypothetical protein
LGYIGQAPANKAITSADIEDGVVSAADLGANSVDSSELVDGGIDLSHMSSQAVDEDNLYISNAGSNGQFLSKQSGNAGGLTWAAAGGDLSFGGDTFGADKTIGANDAYALSLETSGNVAMKIDSSGRITKPLHPSFYAEISGGNQDNIAINTAVTVLLNAEAFDIGSNFNTGTYTFTAPVSGKYHISVLLACNNVDAGASYYQIKLSTSNKAIYLGSWAFNGYSADATYFPLGGSCTCDMDASDTASVEIYQGGGTAQTDLNNGTYMTGHLVG